MLTKIKYRAVEALLFVPALLIFLKEALVITLNCGVAVALLFIVRCIWLKIRKTSPFDPVLKTCVVEVYGEYLTIHEDGKVMGYGKEIFDFSESYDYRSMTREQLRSELETILYYDYQDNKL